MLISNKDGSKKKVINKKVLSMASMKNTEISFQCNLGKEV